MIPNNQSAGHRSFEQLGGLPVAAKALPDCLTDWPSVAVDFAIYSHRKILAEGRALGNEAAMMAIRRTRVWWSVSTLEANPKGKGSRRKQPDLEAALAVLGSHKARLERSAEGMRVVIGSGMDGKDLQDALRVLGIDHLERIFLTEAMVV